MSQVALLLGPVAFSGFEIPNGINLGGSQRVAAHRLADGRRTIDCLGPDDAELSFSGVFAGRDATLRARWLDALRISGAILPLTWDTFFYTVLLRRFEAYYENPAWIPYRLTCTVVQNDQVIVAPLSALLDTVVEDVNAAVSLGADVVPLTGELRSVLAAPNVTLPGTAAFTLACNQFDRACTSLDTRIASAEIQLGAIDVTAVASAPEALVAVNAVDGVTRSLSNLCEARAYMGSAQQALAYQGDRS